MKTDHKSPKKAPVPCMEMWMRYLTNQIADLLNFSVYVVFILPIYSR